jgi:hypothetical protein
MKELPSKFVHFFLLSRYRRTLSRLLDDELSPAQAAEARTHLDECRDCQREYEELRFVKDAVVNLENVDRVPTYADFQARALELEPVETHSTPPIRSTLTLQLRSAAYVFPVAAFGLSCFLLGASYASTSDAVPPIDVAEQRSNSLPLYLLTAPATTPVEITTTNNKTSSPRPPHIQTPDTSQLWEKIAQNQAVNLQNSPEPKRGDLEQLKNDEPPLLIVMSKAHHTGIRLELPQDCEKGKYLLSLERLDGKPLPITAEEESRDGAELNVRLDLRGLAAGKYLLLVERQNEDQREYIGHFTVRMVDPGSSAR